MPKGEIPAHSYWESTAFTGWRRFYRFRAGTRALVKRMYNKRVRRTAKAQQRRDTASAD